ncbi:MULTISPECIES: hypothetical protein [Streptomyces]|uniref:Uncharacterized protein n=1 Tax=Streptomyces tsukubensis (strain DSM 42081 / NBRC 108919 / NRRL 18488 / 9993) TaxID=1114943 RepID=I2N9E3_STRT9|nr:MULTISPECIES: hypothetical protein [Streptomyces]AZK97476.1 hypothetical protein B7R87_29005 [Streptomyces tsukubensis]EIF93640.1 hypothetical protein [Streptomyces tsukubensis NRRL18488]MYS68288.1 hypothetical protein [Streptomyces sp. SID5473]QKM66574.1 hypothetical protein STSU_004775 [Streptomyces tsukubensis NRRL18488]TAI45082.1 hypothetical protein EWI31_07450 [Streptomyces tsukubensis]
MATRSTPPVVLLHDVDAVRADLVTALESADPSLRPGLEEALRIAERHGALTDEQRTGEWVRRTLRAADTDPAADHVRAVKALREAVPGLGLIAANGLVKAAGRS